MGDDGGAKADGDPVMNLHAFRILVFEINVVADKDLTMYLNAAQSVEKRSQIC